MDMSINRLNRLIVIKLILFSSILFILGIGFVGTVYADNMLNDYSIDKKTADEWRNYVKDNNHKNEL